MAATGKLRRSLGKRLDPYALKPHTWVGAIGNAAGEIFPDVRNQMFIWVRDFDGVPHTVLNERAPAVAGYLVKVGRNPERPSIEEVIGQIPLWDVPPVRSSLPSHGETHSFPNHDTAWIHGEQFMPWMAVPSGMTLVIYPSLLATPTGWAWGDPNPIDMSSHVPEHGAAVALISVDENGDYVVTMGEIGMPETISAADIPATPAGTQALWAVKLIDSMTTIEGYEKRRYKYLFDLRWGPGGGGSGSISVSDGETTVSPASQLDFQPNVLKVTDEGASHASVAINEFPTDTVRDTIAAQQDDYAPAGYDIDTRVIEVIATGPQTITGLAAVGSAYRRRVLFYNRGTTNITLTDQDGDSAAANQLDMWGAGDFVLAPGQVAEFQYDQGDHWFYVSDGLPSTMVSERVVLTSALGQLASLGWISIDPVNKQFILGTHFNGISIGGGVAQHIVDTQGHTGGELFLWAPGIGTADMGDAGFAGRLFGVRLRGSIGAPEGVLDGDVLFDLVPITFGDNAHYLTSAELGGAQPHLEHHLRAMFRFVADGDHTDTNRAVKVEIWLTPSETTEAELAFTMNSDGSIGMNSHQIHDVEDPTDDQDAATKKYVDDGKREMLTGNRTIYVRVNIGDCTISNATPAVVTKNGHGLEDGDRVVFRTSGALPTGLVEGVRYYVVNKAANTFNVEASIGGGALGTSSAGSGTHSVATGSDSNDGTAADRLHALLSIQKASDLVGALDARTYSITVQVAKSQYSEGGAAITMKDPVGSAPVNYIGDTSTPSNVTVDAGWVKETPGPINVLEGFRMRKTSTASTYAIRCGSGAFIQYGNMDFSTGWTVHVLSLGYGAIEIVSSYEITGGATRHLYAITHGFIRPAVGGIAITLTGTPAFSAYFADALMLGLIRCQASDVTFSGSATGARFSVAANSVIFTGGAGATYFPGNADGTQGSGGVYV